jgi:hypothetical protein
MSDIDLFGDTDADGCRSKETGWTGRRSRGEMETFQTDLHGPLGGPSR